MAFFLGDTRGRFAALCHVRIAAGRTPSAVSTDLRTSPALAVRSRPMSVATCIVDIQYRSSAISAASLLRRLTISAARLSSIGAAQDRNS
jgi:hypothetical protein